MMLKKKSRARLIIYCSLNVSQVSQENDKLCRTSLFSSYININSSIAATAAFKTTERLDGNTEHAFRCDVLYVFFRRPENVYKKSLTTNID